MSRDRDPYRYEERMSGRMSGNGSDASSVESFDNPGYSSTSTVYIAHGCCYVDNVEAMVAAKDTWDENFFCPDDPDHVVWVMFLDFGLYNEGFLSVIIINSADRDIYVNRITATAFDHEENEIVRETYSIELKDGIGAYFKNLMPLENLPKQRRRFANRQCQLRVECRVAYGGRAEPASAYQFRDLSLAGNMHNLMKSGNLADVVFVVGGARFKCHEAILGARSDHFRRLMRKKEVRLSQKSRESSAHSGGRVSENSEKRKVKEGSYGREITRESRVGSYGRETVHKKEGKEVRERWEFRQDTDGGPREIIIKDVDADIFAEVLTYIYTGTVTKEFGARALRVIPVADKFEMLSLKLAAELQRRRDLNVVSVVDSYAVAIAHNCGYLKMACLLYIKNHRDEVQNRPDWNKVTTDAEMNLQWKQFEADPQQSAIIMSN